MASVGSTEQSKEEGGVQETTVNTVDYVKSAGQDEAVKKENVEIVHQTKPGDETSGVLSAAAAAVTSTVQSAKDVISGKNTKEEEEGSK